MGAVGFDGFHTANWTWQQMQQPQEALDDRLLCNVQLYKYANDGGALAHAYAAATAALVATMMVATMPST